MQMTAKKFTRIKKDLAPVTVTGVVFTPTAAKGMGEVPTGRIDLTWVREVNGKIVEEGTRIVRLHTSGRCRPQHDLAYWAKNFKTLA